MTFYSGYNKLNLLHASSLKSPLPFRVDFSLVSLSALVSRISFLRTCGAAQPLGLNNACLLCSDSQAEDNC